MAEKNRVYRFNSAIVRAPAPSVVRGLRAVDGPDPTYEGVRREHEVYVEALDAAGVATIVALPPVEAFADAIFVEDPALVFGEGAILLRPGAPSRRGETALIAPELEARFDIVLGPPTAGYVDGGDVLVMPDAVMIGLSERTDQVGAEWLVEQLAQLGRRGRIVRTPPGVLHFKTACSLLDDRTVLMTAQMATSNVFDGYEKVLTPDGEAAAANALRVNETVLVGADYSRTIDRLGSLGYTVRAVPTTEIAKIDAGLSCMSLRWYR